MCLEESIWKLRKGLVIIMSSETEYLQGHLYLDI